jgi:formylglycine-generating enzyme required for sulfatase activity
MNMRSLARQELPRVLTSGVTAFRRAGLRLLLLATLGVSSFAGCSSSNGAGSGHGSSDGGSPPLPSSTSTSSSSSSSSDGGSGLTAATSCATSGPGLTNCGPGGSGTESCCTSLDVPAGTFDRTYTSAADGTATGLANPATVSAFGLDKYLVTVGRFRQYVNYLVDGGAPPADGSGKHTHLNGGLGLNGGGDAGATYESGWDAADWNQYIPTGADAGSTWDTKLTCFGPGGQSTWTNSPSSNENLPINCITWFDAYAFCSWDGGFLPSAAEWGYVAAAGSQQREFPWGSTDPGTDNKYAIYGGFYGLGPGGSPFAPVGTATLGAALWGQLDLLGEVFEWNLDFYGTYVDPCTDCADLSPGAARIFRSIGPGGTIGMFPNASGQGCVAGCVTSSTITAAPPASAGNGSFGFRCGRAPVAANSAGTDAGITTDATVADAAVADGSIGDAASDVSTFEAASGDSGAFDATPDGSLDGDANFDGDAALQFDGEAGAEGGAVCPGSVVQGECTGQACSAIIDDMSGPSATQIPFQPPSCAGSGYWSVAVGGSPAGTVTTPSPSSPFTYTTLPAGPPSTGPTAASVGACFAGTTTPQQYLTSLLHVVLAQSSVAVGDAGTLPALIDASAYQGVEFWLWEASDELIPASEFWVLAADKAETRGYGVCDSSATSGPNECVGPVKTIAPQAGWQFVQVPWASFVSIPNTGSENETALDPTTLTGFAFQVQEQAADASVGVPFNFCVLELSFY